MLGSEHLRRLPKRPNLHQRGLSCFSNQVTKRFPVLQLLPLYGRFYVALAFSLEMITIGYPQRSSSKFISRRPSSAIAIAEGIQAQIMVRLSAQITLSGQLGTGMGLLYAPASIMPRLSCLRRSAFTLSSVPITKTVRICGSALSKLSRLIERLFMMKYPFAE